MAGDQIQLLWPVTTHSFYGKGINIKSQTNITTEWIIFFISMIMMLKIRDTATFFNQHNSNLLLSIPTMTVMLPSFIGFPVNVPSWLLPPHLAYMSLFSASIIMSLQSLKHVTHPKNGE